jgi:DNA polymerase-1
MQGTAADIMKRAMINVANWLATQSSDDIKMIMQVHDELVFEINQTKVDEFSDKICQLMSEAAELDVPLVVEADFGDNWEQAH